ncbi:flavodoxin family protein [Desulfoluna sp.]|uniref:flavodoxin family protein n=1 Tax=Desulfoluna sp. TaxID=2045199 RepID=UPI002604C13F|nr:flavodoxin family protein [Desulfoluna sp.]
MKSLVVYSSLTGNTRKVAEAIYNALPEPKEIHPSDEAPSPEDFDFIATGFWVDKGTADAKSRQFMETLSGKKVGLFGTLGAYPDSDHGRQCITRVSELLAGNQLCGTFLCQGKVDPKLIKMMETTMKDDPHHGMTPERRKRHEEAAKHPDKNDLINAAGAFAGMAKAICLDLEKKEVRG